MRWGHCYRIFTQKNDCWIITQGGCIASHQFIGQNHKQNVALGTDTSNTKKNKTMTDIKMLDIISGLANIFTIIASALAIYIYAKNRKNISTALETLINFSFQTTLTELKEKLERLNEYNAGNPDELIEIRNILHEISGQIQGNDKLNHIAPDLAKKIEIFAKNKKLTEPAKRSIVSEVRERLRNIQVNSAQQE